MKVTLPRTSPYAEKDQRKADKCNKFIGRGSVKSSTNAYAKAYRENANCGDYQPADFVFISAEGNRAGRLDPHFKEIAKAVKAGVTFITDDPANRLRHYNVGERLVAQFLLQNGYKETQPGIWKPK